MQDNNILKKTGRIIYKRLTQEYRDYTLVVAARAFCHEPLTEAHLEKRKDNTSAFLSWVELIEMWMDHFISLGVSVIAIEETTNQIVGVSLVKDFHNHHKEFEKKYSEEDNLLTPVIQLVNDLTNRAVALMPELNDSKVADIFLVGVLSEFKGNKIASNLFDLSNELAKEAGYKYTAIEATSSFTSKCCGLLNYNQICTIEGSKWQWNGENVFGSLKEPHLTDIFWVKDVSSYQRQL